MRQKIKQNLFTFLLVGLSLLFVSGITNINADTNISGGNVFDGANLTNNETTFSDPVSANDGDEVVLGIRVVNLGSENAQNVNVKVDLSNAISPSLTISGDNFPTQSDIVSLNPGGTSLTLVSGSVKKFGPPDCFDGCVVGDEIVTTGLNLGTVEPTSLKSFQVKLKVVVMGTPTDGNKPVFRTGNIFDGGNRTDRVVDWQDPIPADPGELIEYRVQIANEGTASLDNTTIQVAFPAQASTSIVTTANLSGTSAISVSDTATVNVSGSVGQTLTYAPGHTLLWGPECENGCALPDGITSRGISLGRVINAGQTYHVTFKATLSNNQPTTNPTSRCVDLTASTTDGTAPLAVTFTGQGEDTGGSIQEYEFDFGDDSQGQSRTIKTTSSQVTHTYHNPGTFEASLKVRDSRNEWKGGNECKVTITSRSRPAVLAAEAPKKLPKTGSEALLIASALFGIGMYVYRRFKLV